MRVRVKPCGVAFFVVSRRFTNSKSITLERFSTMRSRLLKAFSLTVRSELKFENYKHYKGHRITQCVIIGLNISIFVLWKISALDPTLYNFMNKYFCWQNDWFESGSYTHFITTAFSHQNWDHLLGNMFIFLILSKKLFQFLGPGKFWSLYIGGSIGGNVAADVSGAYSEDQILSQDQLRTSNILCGMPTGVVRGLGASDSCMALIIVYYLTFPRHAIHTSKFLWVLERIPRLSPYIQRVKISALWLLPAYFAQDVINVTWPVSLTDGKEKGSTAFVDNYAHFGGFLTGLGFYGLAVRPLRNKYYMKLTGLDFRKWYLMVVSLSFWGALMWWARQKEIETLRNMGEQVLTIDLDRLEHLQAEFPEVIDEHFKKRLANLCECWHYSKSPCFECDDLVLQCHDDLCQRIATNIGPIEPGENDETNWRENFAVSLRIQGELSECVVPIQKRFLYTYNVGDEVEADCENGWVSARIVEQTENYKYRIQMHINSKPHPDIWSSNELRPKRNVIN